MKPATNPSGAVGQPEVARGGCLTAFLVVAIIANAGTSLIYFLNPGVVTQRFPRLSQGLLFLLGVGGLLNIFLAILVWQWRLVGVYGYIAAALPAFLINLYAEIPVSKAVFGLLGPVILALLVRPRWARFT